MTRSVEGRLVFYVQRLDGMFLTETGAWINGQDGAWKTYDRAEGGERARTHGAKVLPVKERP